jgi:hypothetical protein
MTSMKRLLIGVACALVAAVAVSGLLVAQTSPKAHWEPYKTRNVKPSVDQKLTDPALVGAIDLHAHHGPDAYGRQWDAFEVARLAKERGMRAIVLKNHWTETAGLAWMARKYATPGFDVFGSVTLDAPVGGVNPMAVRYMVDVEGALGRIVWMPTHDSEHEIDFNKETRTRAVVTRNGKLIPEVFEVLDLIKQHNLTLATGHLTPEEVLKVMAAAKERGITRIIVTHPLLAAQFTYMSIPQMQEAVKLGGAIEITAGAVASLGPAQNRTVDVIKALGTQHVFVASDSGLVGTPNHPDAMAMAAKGLRGAGFSEQDLKLMFKDTPARLLGLPIQ